MLHKRVIGVVQMNKDTFRKKKKIHSEERNNTRR